MIKADAFTPVENMYINMVMPQKWYNVVLNRILFFIYFILLRIILIIIIIATLKSNYSNREFITKGKGDCLFYVVELDYLFSKIDWVKADCVNVMMASLQRHC